MQIQPEIRPDSSVQASELPNILPPAREKQKYIPSTPAIEGSVYILGWLAALIAGEEMFVAYGLAFTFFYALINTIFLHSLFMHLPMLLAVLIFHNGALLSHTLTDSRLNYDVVEGILLEADNSHAIIANAKLWEKKKSNWAPIVKIEGLRPESLNQLKFARPSQKIQFMNMPGIIKNSILTLQDEEGGEITNLTYNENFYSRRSLNARLANRSEYYLDDLPESLFNALFLGYRGSMPNIITEQTKALGVFHLFAISGLHMGLLMMFIGLFIKLLASWLTPWMQRGGLMAIIILASLLAGFVYVDLIDYRITALRSWLMAFIFIAYLVVVGFMPWYATLPGTAALMLAWNPELLINSGFQLSFLSVTAIFCVGSFLPQHKQVFMTFFGRVRQFLVFTLISSTAIILFTIPVISDFGQSFSLLSPLNNILHIAFFSLIVMPLGFFCLTLTGIFINSEPNWIEAVGYEAFSQVIYLWEILVQLNYSSTEVLIFSRVPDFSLWTKIIYYFAVSVFIFWSVLMYKKRFKDRSR